MKLVTAHYYQKLIIRTLFSNDTYHTLKLYKIILKYLIGKDEDQIYSFLSRILPRNSVIIDVGANMGQYACRLSKAFPEGNIFSIEPFSINFEALKKMKKILKLNNVQLINSAISEDSGMVTLVVPVINGKIVIGTQARLNKINIANTFENVIYQTFLVESTPLDTIVKDFNLKKVDFIKVDTEGFDSVVLKSGHKSIEKYKPLLRIEENCQNDKYNWLTNLGYIPFYLNKKNKVLFKKNTEEIVGDNFLAHKDKLAQYPFLKEY